MKTTAVSFRSICIALSLFSSGLEEGEKDDNIAGAPIGTIWHRRREAHAPRPAD